MLFLNLLVNWLCTVSAVISKLYQPHSPHFTCTLARYSFVLALAWRFRGKSRGDIDAFPRFGPDIGGCNYVSYLICICQHLSVNLGMPSLFEIHSQSPSSFVPSHPAQLSLLLCCVGIRLGTRFPDPNLDPFFASSNLSLATAYGPVSAGPAAVRTTLSTESL